MNTNLTNFQYAPGSQVFSTYHLSDSLSSGSKDVYVYIEPNHILVHELHAPFAAFIDSFSFVAPVNPGPFTLVFYDMQIAGALQIPFVSVTNVQLET
ncbi:hypothetical protein HDU82_005975, partial [Entophlyctis luteolus]